MKSYQFLILLCAQYVFGSENFFLGHYEDYDIPPPRNVDTMAVTTNYFNQTLDHFDPTNIARWSQRYYVNTQHFNTTERNVVFLLIGGEGQAAIQWMSAGAWIQSARKYGALLFQLEHRFYGDSHPFTTTATENLRFLSSQQALEDIVTFISAMNREYELGDDVKWILFGGSYSASLAAWARQKYPHLVQGAMASSGPIFALLDFYEYFEVVANSLATRGQQCVNTVRTAFTQLEEAIVNPGTVNLTSLFNLCLDINLEENRIPNNIAYFFERLSSGIAGVVQYHGIAGQTTIDTICNVLTNETIGRELNRLAEVSKLIYSSCINYRFQALVTSLSNTAVAQTRNSRQWYYQTCTEYGWYQTSSQQEPVIGNRTPVEFFSQLCTTVFGSQFTTNFTIEQNDRINRHFGGYDIDATNVVHVHGSLDPWYPMGLTQTVNPESPVIFITDSSHCADLYPANTNDSPELTQARDTIDWLIGVWLGVNSGIRIQLSVLVILVGLLAKLF